MYFKYQIIQGYSRPVSCSFLGSLLFRRCQVISLCSDARLLESLRECNKLLEQVQKGLSEYLETKRAAFPRLLVCEVLCNCLGVFVLIVRNCFTYLAHF